MEKLNVRDNDKLREKANKALNKINYASMFMILNNINEYQQVANILKVLYDGGSITEDEYNTIRKFTGPEEIRGRQYRLIESIKHQGIGGQVIILEKKVDKEEVVKNAMEGNIACFNFFTRRLDFNHEFNQTLYYGKVNGLGYVVAEDELEEEIEVD